APYDEERVPDRQSLGEVGILGEEIFRVADLEERRDEVEPRFGGGPFDPLEIREVGGVHERELSEVGVLQENGVIARLRRTLHDRDQLLDVFLLAEVLWKIDPPFAELERPQLGSRRAPGEDEKGPHSHGAGMLAAMG